MSLLSSTQKSTFNLFFSFFIFSVDKSVSSVSISSVKISSSINDNSSKGISSSRISLILSFVCTEIKSSDHICAVDVDKKINNKKVGVFLIKACCLYKFLPITSYRVYLDQLEN